MSSTSLPDAWIERLFARFAATWGAQRLGAMFPAEVHDQTRRVWAEQLGRFEGATIARAVQAATDSGRDWPPTLAEFVELCRQAALSCRQSDGLPALPAPRPDVDSGESLGRLANAIAAVRGAPRDPLRWAREPKSHAAVMLLLRGASSDTRLQAILRSHIADAGERLPGDSAAAVLAAVGREPGLVADRP